MKRLSLFPLLLALIICQSHARSGEVQPQRGTANDVIVARLTTDIPADGEKAHDFVWDEFSKHKEIALFHDYSTKEWQKNYCEFAAVIVQKAETQKLEAQVLKECLEQIRTDLVLQRGEAVGYLPMGAYRALQGDHQVWLIFCLWEFADDPSKVVPATLASAGGKRPEGMATAPQPTEWLNVRHIVILTFDIATKQVIGYVSCG